MLGIGALSEAVTLSELYLPSEKGPTLKQKNMLPLRANSFLLEWTPLLKGFWCIGKQTEVTKVVKKKIAEIKSL